jgi:hypothetical protein
VVSDNPLSLFGLALDARDISGILHIILLSLQKLQSSFNINPKHAAGGRPNKYLAEMILECNRPTPFEKLFQIDKCEQ